MMENEMDEEETTYEKCKKRGGHNWQIFDNSHGLTEASVTLYCKDCGAEVEMTGDVRTDDGRYIEWALGDVE